jgi:hypothetical protein
VRVHFGSDDSTTVIERAANVLARVLERVDTWPAEETWQELLPRWFLDRCAPERADDPAFDTSAWMERWRAMSPEEKAAESQEPWRLSSWLYCFDPTEDGGGDDRSWWWWDAGINELGTEWIEVETTGWPFGTGSLYWLIEASGGLDPSYLA